MDSDVATSVDRARRRNQRTSKNGRSSRDENRFEQESRAFFTRVRNGYHAIARRETERVVLINARGTPPQTHAKILEVVLRKLRLAAKSA
jgi:dTMP kinase